MKLKKRTKKLLVGQHFDPVTQPAQSAHFATHEMSPFNSLLSYMAFTYQHKSGSRIVNKAIPTA